MHLDDSAIGIRAAPVRCSVWFGDGSVWSVSNGRRRCYSPSRVEAENRRVQRLGRTHGIEILTQEYDFVAGGTQEEHIVLTVDAPCRLDQALCPHFDGRAWGSAKA